MNILWKDILDFPNYEISTLGQIRNKKTGKELKPNLRKNGGAAQITLCNNNQRRTAAIHILMGEVFLEIKNQPIKHIDGDMWNNRLDNLTTETMLENNRIAALQEQERKESIYQEIIIIDKQIQNLLVKKQELQKLLILDDHNTSDEIWRQINGFSRYEVSSFGRIRSNIGRSKILKPSTSPIGYLRYTLISDTKEKKGFLIHRLVAQAFLSDWDENLTVDHIDKNPSNNNLTNLRMLTLFENASKKV